jgi:hypothetical protein
LALAEKGKTYREITKEAEVSPNTIKAVLNRTGLDETTSIHSRAFELFSEGKTPLQVAIALNLEAEKIMRYHYEQSGASKLAEANSPLGVATIRYVPDAPAKLNPIFVVA